MTEEEIIRRLTWVANAKPGDPLPDWTGVTNGNFAKSVSELARQAINLIKSKSPAVEIAGDRPPVISVVSDS